MFAVTVPATNSVPNVSEPELEIVEPPNIEIVFAGAKIALVFTVRVPFTPRSDDDVAVALAVTFRFVKFSVPPETTMEAPSFSVTVPPGLLNVPVTVNAPATAGEDEPVTVPLTFNPE